MAPKGTPTTAEEIERVRKFFMDFDYKAKMAMHFISEVMETLEDPSSPLKATSPKKATSTKEISKQAKKKKSSKPEAKKSAASEESTKERVGAPSAGIRRTRSKSTYHIPNNQIDQHNRP